MYELAPLLLFFTAFLWKDFFFALVVLMIAAPVALIAKRIATKKWDKMFLWSTIILYPFALPSLYFRDAAYLFWKPSVYYWILSIVIFGSIWIGKKPVVRRIIDVSGELPTEQITSDEWRNLSLVWSAFFVAMGFLNLYVAFNYSLETWVTFKVFGLLGISMVFIFSQVFWIASKMDLPDEVEQEEKP